MKKVLLFIFLAQCLQAQWRVVDSLSMNVLIPAKTKSYLTIANGSNSLRVTKPVTTLSEKALEAVAYAPSWLAIDLTDKFRGLTKTFQDKFGQMILDAKDPFVDEIAFTIAHLSDEILTNGQFYPDVISENARGVYASDSALDYVEVVDSGSAVNGGGYFSTTRYRVEEQGKVAEYSVPKEIYYWYIVHPRLQGEMPSYISTSSGSPAAPPLGKFWRTYVFNYKEGAYPALREDLAGVKTLWNNKKNAPETNGALGRIELWCNKIQEWGNTPSERIPQPVWLYHQHAGTCSEHGWFTNAAGRCALIPTVLDEGGRFDHKWNEFYERGWKDWEAVNGWINRQANDYWEDPAKILNACFIWRGDGFLWGYTEQYTPVCTLNVSVTDNSGRPVDGAALTIDCPGVPGPFCMVGWTNSSGFCSFLLGDDIEYFSCALKSGIGDKSAPKIITNSKPRTGFLFAPKLSGTIPQLMAQAISVPPDTSAFSKIEYSINASTEIVYGKHNYSFNGYSVPGTFSDSRKSGSIDYFICDEDNFKKYESRGAFDAAVLKKDAGAVDGSFTLSSGKTWYAVLSNEDKVVNSAVVSMTAKLLTKSNSRTIRHHGARGNIEIRLIKEPDGRAVIFSSISPEKAISSLTMYDSKGRCIQRLKNSKADAGLCAIAWNCAAVPEGMYYYRLSVDNRMVQGKIAVVR